MKHRSVGSLIVLSFITLGIYPFFWLAETRSEMTRLGHSIPPVKILLAPLVLFIGTALLQFVAHFIFMTADDGSFNSGTPAIVNLLGLVAGIVGLLALLYAPVWFYRYCKAVEVTTNGQTSLGFSYGLLIVTFVTGTMFIWPGLIQDGFNKLAEPVN